MPTGYTAKVSSQEDYPFEKFVWECARAFGALILMRDEPSGARIPTFEPSGYRSEQIAKSKARIAELEAMANGDIERGAHEFNDSNLRSWERRNEENAAIGRRYGRMIALVEAWTPPTPDHGGMKEFMLSQLSESLKFDVYQTYKPEAVGAVEWHHAQLALEKGHVEYHTDEHAKEVQRTRERNAWVSALRASVPLEPEGE